MTDPEIRVKCLEFALELWRKEANPTMERLAELQNWFYARIVTESTGPLGVRKNKKLSVDKAPEMFK